MSTSVSIVDYDCGNIFSVSKAIEHCGGNVTLAETADAVASADRLILPGVGAFGSALGALRERGLAEAICNFAASGKPFLGICVGMQAMLDYSEEFGRHEGLGLIGGHVAMIPRTTADGAPHVIPHIGWSELRKAEHPWQGTLLQDSEAGDCAYFVHSFSAWPENTADVLATCSYNGHNITAAIARDNMTGMQFHPEKSGDVGLTILKRFLK